MDKKCLKLVVEPGWFAALDNFIKKISACNSSIDEKMLLNWSHHENLVRVKELAETDYKLILTEVHKNKHKNIQLVESFW